MIEIPCRCGKRLKVPESYVGQSGKCPFCQRVVRLVAPQFSPGSQAFESTLLCIAGSRYVGDQFVIGGLGPIEIGKNPDKHIRLPDQKVSRSHCRLVRTACGWRLEDRGSTNGVYVNDRRVKSYELRDSDLIRIGDYEFNYLTTLDRHPSDIYTAEESSSHELTSEPKSSDISLTDPITDTHNDDELELLNDNLYRFAEEEDAQPVVEVPPAGSAEESSPVNKDTAGGILCPSCRNVYPQSAKICVQCGVDLKTGRSILTSREDDLDQTYTIAYGVIRYISWIIWIGIYPIASEAFGTIKPYVVRSLVIVTTLISLWALIEMYTSQEEVPSCAHLMLWSGKADESIYSEVPDLPRFQPWQLITHVFVHGGLIHLAGNMLFLMVFGSRVNALVGNIWTAILYPILAVAASLPDLINSANELLHFSLGASGAIMGLAGMYFVFFPVHKVHMAFWYRLGLLFRFRLSYKFFSVRGFWVVLFYIAFDVVYVIFGIEDNVGHWAHLGGFLAGIIIALLMLFSRQANCRGGDLLSVLLGKHAWLLVGKPGKDLVTH